MVHQGTNWKLNIPTGTVCIFFATLFVFGRLITRLTMRADRLGYDDWTLLIAWICYVDEDTWWYSERRAGFCYFFPFVAYGLIKLSVAMFLIRLTSVRWHKILLWFMGITFALYSLTVGIIFAYCGWVNPSPLPTNRWSPEGHQIYGYCPSDAPQTVSDLWIWAIIIDFFLAVFPWFMLWKINMKRSKKLVICISLNLGVIAGALAIEHVIVFYEFTGAEDQAWAYFWGLLELAISFICEMDGGGITVGRKRRHPEHHDGPANAAGAPEDRHMHKRRSGEIYGPPIDSLLAPTVATHAEHAGNDTTVPRTGIVGTRRGTVDEKPVTTTTTNTTSSGTGSGGIIDSMTSGSGYSSLDPPKEGTNFSEKAV
ncbi:hypothetical protein QBC37DRAFT_379248 [Rhypophila decipiens]|uniref:Rhodopsin domain-containing protein n=1 Tax=Rhypophila decipiens TaxID=261697 RepID=A0AAN6XXB2_9PEZI|nr:hypothetical protein QBC37DRAFT_379248 [Rhypophila decipiens]